MSDTRKPSLRLKEFEQANRDRYSEASIEDRTLATLMNLVLERPGIAGILDELLERIEKLEGKQ